jgi:simple sugar transport system permease protein/ribose transport system permease protein
MIAAATGVGLFNGLLIVKLRMNAFMTTLATLVGLGGLSLAITRARGQPILPDGYRWAGFADIGPIPVAVITLLLVFLIAHVVLTRTLFGAHLFAVGGNRRAARAAGVPDERIVITVFTVGGFLCGLAAFLLTGRLGTASTSLSSGALFITIAGAVIGGVSLYGGRGKVSGMLGGLLLMATLTNALNISNIEAEYVSVAAAAIILVAVFVDSIRARRLAVE